MEMIEWFKHLLKEIPKVAPVGVELYYISIKLDERAFMNFAIEVDKWSEKNGGISRIYSPNPDQDSIEIQIGRTYFTVYKNRYQEDPYAYRSSVRYEIRNYPVPPSDCYPAAINFTIEGDKK